ncbi:MAG: HAD family hydrolase [Bacteroides sp.]|jgi:phosphoglycolate phosphatase-like HAD superfamily hydrolase|nr:HAD family hydrolase [Bacteroides sp.]
MKTVRFFAVLAITAYLGLGVFQSSAQAVMAHDDPLALWNEGPAKTSILDFLGTVTDVNNPGFLPVNERVAVFDMDGTILLEKPDFVYFDFVIRELIQQIEENPELTQKQPYKAVYANDWAYFEKLSLYGEEGLYGLILHAYDGFTDEQYRDSAKAYVRTVIDKRYQKPYDQLFFAPMLQLVDYLHENHFEVYIVSGSETEFIRSFCEDAAGIPSRNAIGTTVLSRWVENGNESYFVREHGFVEPVNDEGGKPVNILNRIGKVPVLAVGNSSGDYHMLEYSKNAPLNLQMIVNHDDADREYDYDAEIMRQMCLENGWREISMKNDFKVIFNN